MILTVAAALQRQECFNLTILECSNSHGGSGRGVKSAKLCYVPAFFTQPTTAYFYSITLCQYQNSAPMGRGRGVSKGAKVCLVSACVNQNLPHKQTKSVPILCSKSDTGWERVKCL